MPYDLQTGLMWTGDCNRFCHCLASQVFEMLIFGLNNCFRADARTLATKQQKV